MASNDQAVSSAERQWWKEAVVYQIYPFSFKDTTGNGWGDLNGITSKLPYLKRLGVDVIWLSPIYASPMKDCGYDISDYRAINPDLGTMQDFDNLIAETHKLGLKLVMDLVVNHTSDQHAWFQDSKAGGEKKDWYIWQPPRQGKEPNNWGAIFGGSTWERHASREEYYLHTFDVSQPDLNWENPKVRNAVWEIMDFWLDKGCDGFRMDVINCISKEPGFPDVPVVDSSKDFQYGLKYRFNGPKVTEYLQEMYDKVLAPRENERQAPLFTVGEMPGIASPEQALQHVQNGRPLQMIFHFEHMYLDHQPGKSLFHQRHWKLPELKAILGRFMEYGQDHNTWDSLYLDNHDQPRILSRWADDGEYRVQAAKMLALFHVTGRGTVFIYQGQEIGMANPPEWKYDELRDLEEINHYDEVRAQRGQGADMSDVLKDIQRIGRDNARTPVSWDDSKNAGFSSGTPWIKVNEDYREWNVASQVKESNSVLHFWQKILELRKKELALCYGRFELLDEPSEEIYAYTRTASGKQFTVVCSFVGRDVTWESPVPVGELLLSNYMDNAQTRVMKRKTMALRPFECRLYVRGA